MSEAIKIEIPSSWVSLGYYVYVAKMTYNSEVYYYVGQTGDNHYTTARGPLYRISGHFAKGTSTENQVIKGIKRVVLRNEGAPADQVENILNASSFKYLFFKVADFDGENHKRKRQQTQLIEQYMIFELQKSRTLFNAEVKNQITAQKWKELKEELEELTEKAKGFLKELENGK